MTNYNHQISSLFFWQKYFLPKLSKSSLCNICIICKFMSILDHSDCISHSNLYPFVYKSYFTNLQAYKIQAPYTSTCTCVMWLCKRCRRLSAVPVVMKVTIERRTKVVAISHTPTDYITSVPDLSYQLRWTLIHTAPNLRPLIHGAGERGIICQSFLCKKRVMSSSGLLKAVERIGMMTYTYSLILCTKTEKK